MSQEYWHFSFNTSFTLCRMNRVFYEQTEWLYWTVWSEVLEVHIPEIAISWKALRLNSFSPILVTTNAYYLIFISELLDYNLPTMLILLCVSSYPLIHSSSQKKVQQKLLFKTIIQLPVKTSVKDLLLHVLGLAWPKYGFDIMGTHVLFLDRRL